MEKGFKVVSVGSSEEYVGGTENATGTDLATTLQTLSTCDYFMANDSGVMHLADALGIPLTAIFGPTSAVKNGPLSPGSQVIAVQKDCAPCQFKREKFATCICLRELGPEEVESRVLAHLNVWVSGK
jgi:ADP-heptose:LPS heptosyltransferase